MMMRLLVVVLSIAFGIPIQGVYASADSPSKYLDRMTTVNSSVNSESGGESSGAEGDTIVSHAVRTSHGVILNTVVRNANRLEYVDDDLVLTEGNDDTGLTGEKTVARDTGTSDSNEHTVNLANTDTSGDGQSRSIEWPDGGFTGESTITYDTNGKGPFADGATTNAVTTKYDGYKGVITKYAHTDNVDDAGVQSGGYGNNKLGSKVITISGAESLTVTITYLTESTSYDWVCLYPGGTEGSPAGNVNCSTGTVGNSGKLGGKTKTTKTFTVNGDSVTFWFKSDSSADEFYGYYAVVKGLIGSKDTVTGSYQEPVDPTDDYDFTGWNTRADGSGENLGKGEVYSPSSQTVYAQWKSDWNKWGTVGWKITDDGVLRIRPWEGDTGTTGPVTRYNGAPWYNQASNIKKAESTGTIALNAESAGLFNGCSNLTDLTALTDWDVSKVTNMSNMFAGCSKLTDLTALTDWDVSKVTNMHGMFDGCSSLTGLTALTDWDVSNVTSMSYMFNSCSSLTGLTALTGWNVSKVTSMSYMFDGCSSLTDLTGLASWDVSKVTNMSFMFNNCSSLTGLTALTDWDVSKIKSMIQMFAGCSKLTGLTALTGWDVSKVMNMGGMFAYCSSLQKVGIPSIVNGGQKLAEYFVVNTTGLNSRVITEDLQLGPYTWDELNTEMTTNPNAFNEGHVWVRYTPSWIVTYNANGGVGAQDRSVTPLSEPLTLPESQFLRFGYRFTGWTTQPGPVTAENPLMLPGTTYKPNNPVDGKKYDIYAQWEKIGGEEDQPVTGQSGSLPGWVQVGSENTRNDILPNQSQSVVFTNRYDPGLTSIQFRFTKLMDGNVPDSIESFQFKLFSVSENKVIQTTVNNGASVQFEPITYDKTGEHVYYVRESPSSPQDNVNSNPSIDYDDHLVEVKVTVTEADDATSPSGKKLTATAQITGDTVFRNESKPASLVISKTVTGMTEGMNGNHKDREFRFNVTLLDRENQPVTNKVYPALITSKDDNTTDGSNQAPVTRTITFKDGQASLTLQAGQEVKVNGIPAGYKYTVSETDLPSGYVNTSLSNPSGTLTANSTVSVEAVNDYTVKPVNVTLQAGKKLMGPSDTIQSVSNREFRFTLCKVNAADDTSVVNPSVQDTGGTVNDSDVSSSTTDTCTGVSEAWNDGNGVITFPQLSFDSTGTYVYQIREVKGDTLDMDYDSTVYTVTVTVTDDGQGSLAAGVTYRNDATGDIIPLSSMDSTVSPFTDPESQGIPVFVNRNHVANRLPVTGGTDIVYASIIIAILAGVVFITVMNRRRGYHR